MQSTAYNKKINCSSKQLHLSHKKLKHIHTHTQRIPQGRFWDDDWTVTTTDSCLTAQFEHTLMVTDDGVEILTARPGGERLDIEGAATRMKELEASLARTSPSKSAAKSKKKKAKKATKGFGV